MMVKTTPRRGRPKGSKNKTIKEKLNALNEKSKKPHKPRKPRKVRRSGAKAILPYNSCKVCGDKITRRTRLAYRKIGTCSSLHSRIINALNNPELEPIRTIQIQRANKLSRDVTYKYNSRKKVVLIYGEWQKW